MSGNSAVRRIDWLTVLIYLLLIAIGWVNIYSSTVEGTDGALLDLTQRYGKQLFFIAVSIGVIVIVMALEASFYERFASLFYVVTLVLLLGLFVLGKTIAGATSSTSPGATSPATRGSPTAIGR